MNMMNGRYRFIFTLFVLACIAGTQWMPSTLTKAQAADFWGAGCDKCERVGGIGGTSQCTGFGCLLKNTYDICVDNMLYTTTCTEAGGSESCEVENDSCNKQKDDKCD